MYERSFPIVEITCLACNFFAFWGCMAQANQIPGLSPLKVHNRLVVDGWRMQPFGHMYMYLEIETTEKKSNLRERG